MERTKAQPSQPGGWSAFLRALPAPLLLSLQPILQLYSINTAELGSGDVSRSLIVSALFAVLLLLSLRLVLGGWRKAGLVASPFLLIVYLFGDLSDWLQVQTGMGPVRTDYVFLAFVTLLLVIWGWRVWRGLKGAQTLNTYFLLLSILLFLNSGGRLIVNLARDGAFAGSARTRVVVNQTPAGDDRPDIYYIILDGYGRQDVLHEFYKFDNSDLVERLHARGFYVADQSSSNYIQTMLSLTSSLNMDYLQSLLEQGKVTENRYELIDVLQHSEVRSLLAAQGYEMVSFGNEYKAVVPDAEIFYENDASGITAFESIVLDHTMARALQAWKPFNDAMIGMPYRMHAGTILSTFDRLKETPALDGDYFIYAHIIAPHPPFVFDDQGSFIEHYEPFTLNDANYYIKEHSRGGYIAGYRKQIQYINTLLLDAVDAILTDSTTPPIIIIQGDHGWADRDQEDKLSILNAYHLPDGGEAALYPTITPVNSFRHILDYYFGGSYGFLEDSSYYSPEEAPFQFVKVVNTWSADTSQPTP
jgi:hypothetical protein